MPVLEKYLGLHEGQTCYIFGCGPSLNKYNCDKIVDDGVSICCNASIMAVKSCDYFLFTDPRIMQEKMYFPCLLDRASEILVGNIALYEQCVKILDPTVWSRVCIPSPLRRSTGQGFDFSLVPHNQLVAGGSVIVSAHLAHLMGCAKIVLVGVDMGWTNGQKYFHDRSDPELWPSIQDEEEEGKDRSCAEAMGHWSKIHCANPGLPVFLANNKSMLGSLYPGIDMSRFERE